jgi:zinc transporter ZupT
MNLNLLLTLSLTCLHLFADKLHWLKVISPKRWLSFSGGVAIAYVLVNILPSLSQDQQAIIQAGDAIASSFMQQVYVVTLVGLLVFYGLEILAMESSKSKNFNWHPTPILARKGGLITPFSTKLNRPDRFNINQVPKTFWLHLTSAALSNALFSYLLNHTAKNIDCLLLFVALTLHYLVVDRNLQRSQKVAYDRIGRWVLVGALWLGSMLRLIMPVGGVAIAFLKAFLAGGIILGVLTREIPERQESCFWSFVSGAAVYTTILLLV